ncbi:FO synthase subunit 1 [Durusdinium trenchii]|uniref:FO synthase subunit 1 n=1 Tax=Durusdinium trenchii TaxID=1381693 RepID=A0ABP0RIQ0_9DINO
MRYLRKGLPKVVPSEGRAKIVSFLESVYNSIAETLPDVRDDWDGDVAEGLPELADAYADALMKRKKGKRARKNSLVINTQRFEGRELRFLPPGCMRDYYEQMNAAGGSDCPPCGFVTFWRVWREEFPFLLFRSTSSHTICSTCTHHKIMIKELHGHLRGKFAYPRSELFRAKELATLNRPRAHITGMICHGIIHAARLRNLRSGHSHEDVDQAFGLLASHLAKRARKAVGPPEFRTIIQDWLDGVTRVHEKGIAERNVIDEKTRDQILKHVPVMKSFKMFEAAEYMEAWVLDKLPLEPLLDASALGVGKDDRKHARVYVGLAKERIVLESAAHAWSKGVPWAEALDISEKALKKAEAKAKPLPKGRARRNV